MIHIIKWNTASEIWEGNLLEVSLENVVSEIFQADHQRTGFALIEDNIFALLLQGEDGDRIPPQSLTRQLQFLSSVCIGFCIYTHIRKTYALVRIDPDTADVSSLEYRHRPDSVKHS